MEEESVTAFNMMVQFMYTGVAKPSSFLNLTEYIKFFRLVNKFLLTGCLDAVIEAFRKLSSSVTIGYIRATDLKLVFGLPPGHKARAIVVDVCR